MVQIELLFLQGRCLLPKGALQLQFVRGQHFGTELRLLIVVGGGMFGGHFSSEIMLGVWCFPQGAQQWRQSKCEELKKAGRKIA